jgi:predicted nucleic acid-binding protein
VNYLIDTNIVSELRKPSPDPNVTTWIGSVGSEDLYLSVVTIGEIEKGVQKQLRLNPSAGRNLRAWLETLLEKYGDRVVPVDVAIARRWGVFCDAHPGLETDMLIAATAIERQLIVVTRNVRHFAAAGLTVVNPFEPAHGGGAG